MAPAATSFIAPPASYVAITNITTLCSEFSGKIMTSETLQKIRNICQKALSPEVGSPPVEEEKKFIQIIENNLSAMDQLITTSCNPYFPPQLLSVAHLVATAQAIPSDTAKLGEDVVLYTTGNGSPIFVEKKPAPIILEAEKKALFCLPPHKNVVAFAGIQKTTLSTSIFLGYGGNDLQRTMNPDDSDHQPIFSSVDLWNITISLVSAVAHLHKNNVLHRDLKSENIFLNKDLLQLGDLGFAHYLPLGKTVTDPMSFCGTLEFFAPEQMQSIISQPKDGKTCYFTTYSMKADAWAIGCTLFELLYDNALLDSLGCIIEYPEDPSALEDDFKQKAISQIQATLLNQNVQNTIDKLIDAAVAKKSTNQSDDDAALQRLASLIKGCLRVNPEERASIMDLEKKHV